MRKEGTVLLLIAATVMAIFASWSLRQGWITTENARIYWALLVGSGCVAGLLFWSMEAWLPGLRPPAPPSVHPVSIRRQLLGWLLLTLGVAITAWVTWMLWPNYRQWGGTFLPWLAAIACALTGAFVLGKFSAALLQTRNAPVADDLVSPTTQKSGVTWPQLEPVLFLLFLLLAIFLRVYRIQEIPPAIFVDETNGAMDALYLMEGRDASPFGTGWYEIPNAYVYFMAGVFQWFGVNLVGLKAASLIPAILTIPALYFLARLLFGRSTGLAAMFLLAVNRWHLTMSRWGWIEVLTPLVQVIAAYFLMRGLLKRRALDFALGGLLSGAMIYTYLSSRLALAAFVLFALAWFVMAPEGPLTALRFEWRGWFLYFVCAAIMLAPLAVTYTTDPFTFGNRTSQISVMGLVREQGYQPVLDNVKLYAQIFHQMGDQNGRHNLPGEPHLDPITGALFVMGLGYAVLRPRDRRRLLLLLWFLVGMAGGFLSDYGAVNVFRILIVAPAILILAADAGVQVVHSLASLLGGVAPFQRRRTLLAVSTACVVLIGLLGFAAFWDVTTYFGLQAASSAVHASFNQLETQLAKEVTAELAQGGDVYLSSRFYNFSPLRFMVHGVVRAQSPPGQSLLRELDNPPYSLLRPEVDLPLIARGKDVLFLLEPYFVNLADYFRIFYPQITFEAVQWNGQTIYVRARLPANQVTENQGASATYTTASGALKREAITIPGCDSLAWKQAQPVRAEWQGLLLAPQSGYYSFAVDSTTPKGAAPTMLPAAGEAISLTVDGVPWSGLRFLSKGHHTFSFAQDGKGRPITTPASLWWQPPNRALEATPAASFFQTLPPNQGLAGAYFDNASWSGVPVFRALTPVFSLAWPDGEPFQQSQFSARFTGNIRIAEAGTYGFAMNADDGARLTINGVTVLDNISGELWPAANLDLQSGEFSIQIDYVQQGGGSVLELFWTPPGAQLQLIPPTVLQPDGSFWDTVSVAPTLTAPDISEVSFVETETRIGQPDSPLIPKRDQCSGDDCVGGQTPSPLSRQVTPPPAVLTAFGVVKSYILGVESPKSVAVGQDGAVYVTDPSRSLVAVLLRDGSMTTLQGGPLLSEPFDVAVDEVGLLYVLDSENRRVDVYDANRKFIRSVANPDVEIHRARGLDVDDHGNLWIALTARGQIVALDPSGALLLSFDVAPGLPSQPADVAVVNDDSIFVTDAESAKLFRFNSKGQKQSEWRLPGFGTFDSARLTVASDGSIYLSEPEQATIALLAPDGQRKEGWSLIDAGVVKPSGVAIGPDNHLWVADSRTGLTFEITPR